MMGTAPTDETATETAAESHDEDEEPVVQPTTSSDHTPPTPESDLEVLRALDKFLDDIDTDLPTARERSRARDHFDLKDRLGGSTTTQETLSFDYVREDGIAVDGDSYIGLLKVHPQNWLSLSEQARHDTMSAYMSFLMALEFSVAVPCYPKTFDLTGHLERFYTASSGRLLETRRRSFSTDGSSTSSGRATGSETPTSNNAISTSSPVSTPIKSTRISTRVAF